MSQGQSEPRQLSANTLAFVGDAVFGLFIRERMIYKYPGSVHHLHNISTRYVKASAQAYIVMNMMEKLTETEVDIYKRGRNTRIMTMPKNAELKDYRHATGFEAILGYLHLSGSTERLHELLEMAAEIIEKR